MWVSESGVGDVARRLDTSRTPNVPTCGGLSRPCCGLISFAATKFEQLISTGCQFIARAGRKAARLSLGSDRAANIALHRIALVRMSSHPQTCGYVEHQGTKGRTKKEIYVEHTDHAAQFELHRRRGDRRPLHVTTHRLGLPCAAEGRTAREIQRTRPLTQAAAKAVAPKGNHRQRRLSRRGGQGHVGHGRPGDGTAHGAAPGVTYAPSSSKRSRSAGPTHKPR
jgi:hypothetical protein